MADVPTAIPTLTLSSQVDGVASMPTRVEQPTPGATSTPEPAVLAPDVAPPTPVDQPAVPTGSSQPARLVVPDIGLDSAPVAVGLDERRIPIVPRHDVGWFNGGAAPGQSSNVVFWGHVLRWKDAPDIPAPFARVHELQPGAELIVVTADGTEHRYQVTQQIQVRPEDVQYIYPTTQERVTLVSCIGDNVILNGTLTKEFRLVTIAEPISRNQSASTDDAD